MWIVLLALTAFLGKHTVVAFPQNVYEVDGFAFDGPVNRPISPLTTRSTPSTPPTTTAAIRTTKAVLTDDQYNTCFDNCPSTSEYNPVCGSDNGDYENPGRLNCAAACGKAITIQFYGRCLTGQFVR